MGLLGKNRKANASGKITWSNMTVVENTDVVKEVLVEGLTFSLRVFKVPGGWRCNGSFLPDGSVAGATSGDRAVPTWQECFDTLNVRSIGQSVGRVMRDMIEPPNRAAGGKSAVSTVRKDAEAQVDLLITLGKVTAAERDATIDALVIAAMARREAVEKAKGEAGKEAANAPGAVTGIQTGTGKAGTLTTSK